MRRKIAPMHTFTNGIGRVSQNPGVGPGWVSSLTTWASANDHSKTFGTSGCGFFAWNLNLFPSFFRGLSAVLPKPNVALDRAITINATLDLLDATGALLTQATWVSHEHDTYPAQPAPGMQENFTTDQATCLGTGPILSFNAVRATISASPLYAMGEGPDCGYFLAASIMAILYYYLQLPVEA